MTSTFSRRQFGSLLTGALGGVACSTSQRDAATTSVEPSGAPARKRIPIAVESWCFKELLAQDPEGIIAQVAEMGYEGIELAHYYRWDSLTAPRVRQALDANKLRCCSSHVNLESLTGDALSKTLEYHHTIGNTVLIVASLPHQEAAQGWLDMAKRFGEMAGTLGEHKMRLGYHNHAGDFIPMADGQVPWEVFFNHTPENVIHQLDVGNMPKEYQDPIKYLKMYPGRTQSIHVKDRSAEHEQVLVGDGVLPFRDIFDLCSTIGGTEWYIVEYEDKAYPPMEAVRRCLESMKRILA